MTTRKSFATEVSEISRELGIPKATVERVLRTRLEHQLKELRSGNTVTVEGLFSIKVVTDTETGKALLRGSVSPALRRAVANDGYRLRVLNGTD